LDKTVTPSLKGHPPIFMNPADAIQQQRNDNKILQDDLIGRIIQNRRQMEMERVSTKQQEQDDMQRAVQEYQYKLLKDKNDRK